MAVIKVSIKDNKTLQLEEDAKKGDLIDLSCLTAADVSSVSESLKSAAKRDYEREFELGKKREIEVALMNKQNEINMLNEKMSHREKEIVFRAQQKLQEITGEKEKLESALKAADSEYKLSEQKSKEYYDRLLKDKEQEIERYRDMKSKLSTKLIGQSLEDHCELEFEQKMRPFVGGGISFGKDNDAREGTKGDYIFCERDENGIELISIMFEMKNEEDGGVSSKKKNDDFLKKLNDDRNNKNCEYAVLVSMLEPENDLYNGGIVDKSHKYPKMYVIRPQFFIPMITLLRNAAAKAASLKKELAVIKGQNTDITKFEDELNDFKNAFGRNAALFRGKIEDAVERLERQKKQIQDIIDLFKGGEKQLDWAGDKLNDLSVKKLTKDNPTMAEKFDQIRKAKLPPA